MKRLLFIFITFLLVVFWQAACTGRMIGCTKQLMRKYLNISRYLIEANSAKGKD